MANLKEIRIRISSVESTMQITSAMKMVSAAKLKRAQDAIIQLRPYANKLTEMLVNLSASLDSGDGNVFSGEREVKNILFVTITSNRGLCGGFNSNIIKRTCALIKEEYKNRSEQFLKYLKIKCLNHKIDLVEVDINNGIEQILVSYLLKRQKMF